MRTDIEHTTCQAEKGEEPLAARMERYLASDGLHWVDLDKASARIIAEVDRDWTSVSRLPTLPLSLPVKKAAVRLAVTRAMEGGYNQRGAMVLLLVGPTLAAELLEVAHVQGFLDIQAWAGPSHAARLQEWQAWFVKRTGESSSPVVAQPTTADDRSLVHRLLSLL